MCYMTNVILSILYGLTHLVLIIMMEMDCIDELY